MADSELKSLLLAEPRLTLAVAESLTCGGVQSRIGGISGASEFFLGGITAYDMRSGEKRFWLPNGGFIRLLVTTLAKLRKMPCAVSGRR